MKDNELRGIILKRYYDRRREDYFQWSDEDIGKFTEPINAKDVFRICDQLAEHNLIHWKPIRLRGETAGGMGKISAFGVDVIEGTANPPISIIINHSQHISVQGSSNIQIGDSNVQSLNIEIGKIISAIDGSSASGDEKQEAKSLLKKFLENSLIASIAGGLASQIKL